jgi:hypothetical protein
MGLSAPVELLRSRKSNSQRDMKKLSILILLVLLLLLSLVTAPAASVGVAFDDDINQGVTYRLHWGTNTRSYPFSMNIGTNKIGTITNLNSGTRYFFAATAVGASGVASDFSNEIQHVTPIVPPTNTRAVTNVTQAAVSPQGPWKNIALQVVDLPEPYSFARVEIHPRKLD